MSEQTDKPTDEPKKRITVKWLKNQPDNVLYDLADKWPYWCCRGRMIRREIESRIPPDERIS